MSFGGWSIGKDLYDFISQNLSEGKSILEFGSGESTQELIKKWNVYSVEENVEWSGKYHNKYILAPIENKSYSEQNGWDGWYNTEILSKNLPSSVDLILVDGPCYGNRNGLFNNKELILNLGFELIIFDDIERNSDLKCYNDFVNYYKVNNISIETGVISGMKSFGYIKILN